MKNNRILISQSNPTDVNSVYFKLAEKHKLEISFVPFFSIAPVDVKEFKQQRIKILEHTAVIFSSKNSIDYFFKICQQLKLEIPREMKYFCTMELVANYLQKYIVPKKRKIFVGQGNLTGLFDLFLKHKEEKYLFICSQNRRMEIAGFFEENSIDYSEAALFNVSSNDLSGVKLTEFGILAFFSPADVKSLFDNFPSYEQNETLIACFGPATVLAAKKAGLKVDIEAPIQQALSMSSAIELYLKNSN